MNWRERTLKRIAAAIYNQYPLIIVIAILLTIVSLGISGLYLKTKTGRIDLISDQNPATKRFLNFLDEFGSPDDVVLLVQGGDAALREQGVEKIAQTLLKEKGFVQSVFYKIPLNFFREHGFQYADSETLNQVSNSLDQFGSFLQSTDGAVDLNTLFQKIDQDIQKSFSQRRQLSEKEVDSLKWFLQFLSQMQEGKPFSFYEKSLSDFKDHPLVRSNGFMTSKSQNLYFLFVKPTQKTNDFKFIKIFLESIKEKIQQVELDFPDLEISMTGVPPIIYEEMVATTRDVKKASVLSFAGITLLFMLCFQAFRKPLMVVTVMFMGIAYTFCFATLAVGSLNLMSIVFASMILGSGNDFGVHILMRYREERLSGHSCQQAIEVVISQTGQGIISGAIATALVFYTLMFSNFKGFSEFGLISGTGVLICCVSMLIVVPAFLVLWEKSGKGTAYYDKKLMKQRHKLTMPHVAKLLHFPKTVIVFCLILTGFFFYTATSVRFNGSLLDIQAKGSKSFANEQMMLKDSPLSPRFGAVVAKDLQEVKRKSQALKKLPIVSHVESIVDLLPDISKEKADLLKQIKEKGERLKVKPSKAAVDIPLLKKTISKIIRKIERAQKYVAKKGVESDALELLFQLKERLLNLKFDSSLQDFQIAFQEEITQSVNQLKKMSQEEPLQVRDLPVEIQKRFVGKSGDYLIYVYPKISVWDDGALTRFTEEVFTVDSQATGTPFLVQEVTRLMENGYRRSGWIALLVVTLLLFIDFRRVIPTLLALVPLIMGVVWMIGLMGILGIEFNPANLIAVPLILGIAIDNGVHLVHRFYEKKAHRLDHIMRSTIKAVYLNSITTMVCFGSLILASHRGISSLGMVLVLGVLTCLITAITFLPALLSLLRDRVLAKNLK